MCQKGEKGKEIQSLVRFLLMRLLHKISVLIFFFLVGNKTTSWEVYNVFLRQLVDQLIGLGASKDMKIVAFQLWACYLRQCGVAFVSKDEKTLPALSSLGFRNE